ncbi:hypothetical protein ACFQ7N_10505 [Streptomyces niveus]|uniref:hypothetical protein n=1 Tax=Streptomyces niveus TaxID=193462 RepID=UPI00369E3B4A
MSSSTIDDLLADASVPVSAAREFDVGAALRRLAADAARTQPSTPDMERLAAAGERLSVVSRWILNGPGAALHMAKLTDESPVDATVDDIDGPLVFGCLLHLTGHPESAQFWWQLAAGAGNRLAAYCLHLHHLSLGETKEARHWGYEVAESSPATGAAPPGEDFFLGLEVFARYIRNHGGVSRSGAPTGRLEMEIDRLADGAACIIVRHPDRRLVDQLRDDVTGR